MSKVLDESKIEVSSHIHTRNFARIRSLRSKEKQNFNAVKHEHDANDESINNIISAVRNKTKWRFNNNESATIKIRNSKKNKDLRDARKIQTKEEVKEEDHTIVPADRERFKN